jgi:hypothetical protein
MRLRYLRIFPRLMRWILGWYRDLLDLILHVTILSLGEFWIGQIELSSFFCWICLVPGG